jgi:hydrogenase maturation protease
VNGEIERSTGKESGLLVLGLGNVLLGDDGLGAAALACLERDYIIPLEVRLEDGGTLGLSLLGLIADADHVILVDAVRADVAPGTLIRLDGAEVIDAVRDRLSPHQVGVSDLLEAARLIDRYPSAVTLIGLVPQSIELGVVRSRAVDENLGRLVAAVVHEVESLGYKLAPQPSAADQPRPIHDLTRHFGM